MNKRGFSQIIVLLIVAVVLALGAPVIFRTLQRPSAPPSIEPPSAPITTTAQNPISTQGPSSKTFYFPPIVEWQMDDPSGNGNVFTLTSVSVTHSFSADRGVNQSNFVLSLIFKIKSGSGTAQAPGAHSPMFCTSGFSDVLKLVSDEAGHTVKPDAVEPADYCIYKNSVMDNAKADFTVPEPGSYTFVLSGPADSAPKSTNFTVVLNPDGTPTLVGGVADEKTPAQTYAGTAGTGLVFDRDSKRINDLRQAQNYLELYDKKCGFYPGVWNCAADTAQRTFAAAGDAVVRSNIGVSQWPVDPLNRGEYVYQYGAVPNQFANVYVIGTTLEDPNDWALYGGPTGTIFGVSCDSPVYCIKSERSNPR